MLSDTFLVARGTIAKQYALGWLWVDVVSTVPWDAAFKLFDRHSTDQQSDGGVQTISRGMRLFRLLRLLRVLRYVKLRKFLIHVVGAL